jgi:hypothetical protein
LSGRYTDYTAHSDALKDFFNEVEHISNKLVHIRYNKDKRTDRQKGKNGGTDDMTGTDLMMSTAMTTPHGKADRERRDRQPKGSMRLPAHRAAHMHRIASDKASTGRPKTPRLAELGKQSEDDVVIDVLHSAHPPPDAPPET